MWRIISKKTKITKIGYNFTKNGLLMRDFKNIIIVLVAIVFISQLLMMKDDANKDSSGKLPLIALSTFSLYDIAKNVAQDTLDVFMILPAGVDAHSFEPTPKLMADISKSDLVVYSGAGLEPWITGFDFKSKVIDMSKYVNLKELGSGHNHEEEQGDEEESHHKNALDPHYWLDIDNMIKATNIITAEFIKISPQNKELYTKNSEKYIANLQALESDYKRTFSTCQKKTIIVNHNAFSYISHKYGFNVEALSGFSPEAQPSAKNMARLIEHVKEHNISTIFFESFVSDRAIKSIAQEAKVSVDVLQPLGNITADEQKQNLGFEAIMRINLAKLSKALECR